MLSRAFLFCDIYSYFFSILDEQEADVMAFLDCPTCGSLDRLLLNLEDLSFFV